MGKARKRPDTGKWEICFKNELGKRKRLSHFKTKKEADIASARIETELQDGTYKTVDKQITVKEASDKYLRLYVDIHCKKSSKEGYEGYLKNHILPMFGSRTLISIKKSEVEEFVITLLDKKLANMTINHILNLFGAVYEKMIDDDIVKLNPVARVKRLSLDTKPADFFTPEEVKKCLDTAYKFYPQYYALLYSAIFTGLRQGELFALTWDDIDFDNNTITINKSFSKGRLTTPKTKTSKRIVSMNPSNINVLKKWKDNCVKNENNLVFPNHEGKYLDSRNVVQRFFYPCTAKAGVKKIKWHCLRHTYVSLSLSGGAREKHIQKQVGHSSSQITMDIYAHLMPEDYDKGNKAIDKIFSKPKLRLIS